MSEGFAFETVDRIYGGDVTPDLITIIKAEKLPDGSLLVVDEITLRPRSDTDQRKIQSP